EPLEIADHEMRLLKWVTEDMSGADIEALVDAGKGYMVLNAPPEGGVSQPDGHHKALRARLILGALPRQAFVTARVFTSQKAETLMGPLERVLEEAGLTQAECGEILGVSQSAISRRLKREETGQVEEVIALGS